MKADSLRDWLEYIKGKNYVTTVKKKVDPKYELAAVIKRLEKENKTAYFKAVGDYDIPVVSGICSNRNLFAEALDTNLDEMIPKFIQALANPIRCKIIDRKFAAVKQNVIKENIDILKILPIPIHHEKDAGPYITAGLLIAKDPETGIRNVSIHRLQVTGKNRLGILILPRHLSCMFQKAEESKKTLDIAIAIGCDPFTLLASQAITPYGIDELEIAGALKGKPLELVKGETVDVEYPASAEIVLEGRILPGVRAFEGPFGEFPKYYGPKSKKPVIEISCIFHRNNPIYHTILPAKKPVIEISCIFHRNNPIYHTILPASKEHLLLGAIPREANLYQLVKHAVSSVKNVHITLGGTCRYHAVISIKKRNEGEAKNAIFAAFTSTADIKHVVVVDDDVDIFNMEDVEWAIATRFQADRDMVIISNALGSKLDPSTDEGLGAKMGLDATVPLNAPVVKFEKISIPGVDDIKIEYYL